jgi:hypothetical protein
MKLSREEQVQKDVTDSLIKWNLYPESVVYTFCIGNYKGDSGLLAITFFFGNDLDEFLDKIDYRSQCDKSSYYVLKGDNTIILTGNALLNLYTLL